MDKKRIEAAVTEILLAVGENPEREGLKETPKRVAKMYEEIFSGLHDDPARHLKIFHEPEPVSYTHLFDNIEPLREFLAQNGLETGGTGSKVRPVVSCKGTTCQYGLIDTFALSEEIHERFYHGYHDVKLPHKFKIAVGGCPNNCVKPDLNDLGIIGQRIPQVDLEKCRGCKEMCIRDSWNGPRVWRWLWNPGALRAGSPGRWLSGFPCGRWIFFF